MRNGNLSRRIMTDDGWSYFCNKCGVYRNESEFYRRKKSRFGIDTRCKKHYQQNQPEDLGMAYLNLHAVRPSDFEEAQQVLQRLGYVFCPDCPSVHEQFIKKHQSKWGNKN